VTARVAVLIPSSGRPAAVTRVLRSLLQATPGHGEVWEAHVIAEADDPATWSAAEDAGFTPLCNERARSYAGAVNSGYLLTGSPVLFCGADDLRFHRGWLQTALRVLDDPDASVVGTNDLGHGAVIAGDHATHYLLRRSYCDHPGGCVDGPGTVLHEGYGHSFTDTELVETAKARGVFRPCLASVVEHLHPSWGKAGWDDTYRKGAEPWAADERLFESRRPLWAC
jgi:glycosyltransferase involved in cell wall biosynthesis